MFTCTYGVLSTIQKFQTPLKKDATVNVLSESITGKITHIHHAEKVDSFLLHQISCSFQTESDNFFKYDYYQSKNSFITSTILKTMNKYINIEPYKVLNAIEIYHSLNYTEDEMDQLSKPGESYYIMNPYFLLLKNNDEIIQLHSSHPINDEMILTIISDLNW